MKNISFCLLLAALALMSGKASGQQTFYDLDKIQKIEITFARADWDAALDSIKPGDEYLKADLVTINGVPFTNAGVKFKGNSSYDSTYKKNPYHIALDEFTDQSYQNITDIKLSNCFSDPSMIREVLAYQVLQNYMEGPRANFAQLYINGSYIGLYSNIEDIGKTWSASHFKSLKTNTFIKCNPIINPSPSAKSNLKYLSADTAAYYNFYELKSKSGWYDLVALADSVTNHASNISSVMDMDRLTWMLAFNNLLVNLDSYTGAFCQNYYLFRDNSGFYNPVVWDLNMSFGGFPYAGSSNSSMGTLSIANMQQMPPSLHATDQYWPLINAVMANPTYKKMYYAHMRAIASEFFANASYQAVAAQLQALIDTAVASDPFKFYTYAQFTSGLTVNVSVGSYDVPGISTLMAARLTYLNTLPEFSAAQPVLTEITPALSRTDSMATVTVKVTNATAGSVFLGSRLSINQKFTRTQMSDDGAHNDGAANDGIYGASFRSLPGYSQYYVYAENAAAGVFSPARAEKEFYTVALNTGMDNLSAQPQGAVTIFPNPAKSEVNIAGSASGHFMITNLLGEIVHEGMLDTNVSINTTGWKSGMYIIRAGQQSIKLIINN